MTGTLPSKETQPIIHVYPENDTRQHRLTPSMECWCNPTLTDLSVGMRVTHNAKDEREFVEENLGELLDKDKTWATKLI